MCACACVKGDKTNRDASIIRPRSFRLVDISFWKKKKSSLAPVTKSKSGHGRERDVRVQYAVGYMRVCIPMSRDDV